VIALLISFLSSAVWSATQLEYVQSTTPKTGARVAVQVVIQGSKIKKRLSASEMPIHSLIRDFERKSQVMIHYPSKTYREGPTAMSIRESAPSAPSKPRTKGRFKKIGDWQCEMSAQSLGARKISVCLTPSTKVGIQYEELKLLAAMGLAKIRGNEKNVMVWIRTPSGKGATEMRLVSVKQVNDFGEDYFKVPDGYEKIDPKSIPRRLAP
jgi:hypothetical protein